MKGDSKVIKHLNTILKNELTAINQYFLHSRLLDDWGVTKMAKHAYKESIEEMQHADKLIQRIITIEGFPNLQDLGKLNIGQNVEEIIRSDLQMELDAIRDLKAAVVDAESVQDFVSRDLFVSILSDEEGHVDLLETQLQQIQDMGLQNFIQIQSGVEED